MAIFDRKKTGEGAGQQVPPSADVPVESPELYTQTVSMMANLLISNTAAMLGKVPHPDSGQTFRSLESAELLIDLLQTLKEKSASKLPPEAMKQIAGAISDLQMLYVEEASAAGDFSKANRMRQEVESVKKKAQAAQESSSSATAAAGAEKSPPPAASEQKSAEASKKEMESKVKFTKKYE